MDKGFLPLTKTPVVLPAKRRQSPGLLCITPECEFISVTEAVWKEMGKLM